jgi:hypothetical protein
MESIEPPADDAPLNRFVAAQSWWLASELLRRHPSMIIQWADPTGIYDCLTVADTRGAGAKSPVLWLNRLGTIQVHSGEQSTVIATWDDVMASSDPHQYVRATEPYMGLKPPMSTPPATPRTLSYRFMSALLDLLINDRDRWDWSPEVAFGERAGKITGFPNAQTDFPHVKIEGWEPEGLREAHFWSLTRDGAAIAMASDLGCFYVRDSSFDLMEQYQLRDRDLRRLAADLSSLT